MLSCFWACKEWNSFVSNVQVLEDIIACLRHQFSVRVSVWVSVSLNFRNLEISHFYTTTVAEHPSNCKKQHFVELLVC